MVIELLPGPLIGLADDHHQRGITDMGLPGTDAGKAGRHLILPPGWDEPVPDGHLAARSDTWLVLLALRALPMGGDLDAAIKLLTSVRVYPLNGGNANGVHVHRRHRQGRRHIAAGLGKTASATGGCCTR